MDDKLAAIFNDRIGMAFRTDGYICFRRECIADAGPRNGYNIRLFHGNAGYQFRRKRPQQGTALPINF